jgi:hypothetical protein
MALKTTGIEGLNLHLKHTTILSHFECCYSPNEKEKVLGEDQMNICQSATQ